MDLAAKTGETSAKALRGDEAAIIRQLWDDRRNLRSPVFYRAKLTIDDQAARQLLSVPEQHRERVLRDAVDRIIDPESQ